MFWECPVYDSIRNTFMIELENLLVGEFSTLDNFNLIGTDMILKP